MTNPNIDQTTVDSFGEEWAHFDQSELVGAEWEEIFDTYFRIFPFDNLPAAAEGFDMGCGSGRWARGVAPKVGHLNCIDPAKSALAVAKKNLSGIDNVTFHNAGVDDAPISLASQDFGYSLGVLHHIPQTLDALKSCTKLLKPGAPFLLYLYYRFDNRPAWFRGVWKASEMFRSGVSRLPDSAKPVVTDLLAATVYWPLARSARLMEKLGGNPAHVPLSFYRDKSFYTMRTDSRDRFGTPLEQRFTRAEITQMMTKAGLENISFSDREPFWVAVGHKAAEPA